MFFIKKDEKKVKKPQFDPDDRVPSWIPFQNPSKVPNTEYSSKSNEESH